MPDSSKREREPVSPLELVTSAFEIVGVVLVVAGLGWQAAVFVGGPVGLLVAGAAAVVASWVFTGGVARLVEARAKRRAERERAAREAAAKAAHSGDGPVLVPEPAVTRAEGAAA